MKKIIIKGTTLEASAVIYGCMHMGGNWNNESLSADVIQKADTAIRTALDNDINFFDLADLYCWGKSEEVMGVFLKHNFSQRDKMIIQSKCGAGRANQSDYERKDFFGPRLNANDIKKSVEGSLGRLGIDCLDILLLHVSDTHAHPEEIATILDELHQKGMVRHFGVSNHNRHQMELLQKYSSQKLILNQLPINLMDVGLLDSNPAGTVEYCQMNDIFIQAFPALCCGFILGRERKKWPNEAAKLRVNNVHNIITRIAEEQNVPAEAICIAWLLDHPAIHQALTGTLTPQRIINACQADKVTLSKNQWYELFFAAKEIEKE